MILLTDRLTDKLEVLERANLKESAPAYRRVIEGLRTATSEAEEAAKEIDEAKKGIDKMAKAVDAAEDVLKIIAMF